MIRQFSSSGSLKGISFFALQWNYCIQLERVLLREWAYILVILGEHFLKINGRVIPECPYCGWDRITCLDNYLCFVFILWHHFSLPLILCPFIALHIVTNAYVDNYGTILDNQKQVVTLISCHHWLLYLAHFYWLIRFFGCRYVMLPRWT